MKQKLSPLWHIWRRCSPSWAGIRSVADISPKQRGRNDGLVASVCVYVGACVLNFLMSPAAPNKNNQRDSQLCRCVDMGSLGFTGQLEIAGVEWSTWSGVAWRGTEWSGVEWSGVEWSGVEWSGIVCRYRQA